jgi:hypothetical protein
VVKSRLGERFIEVVSAGLAVFDDGWMAVGVKWEPKTVDIWLEWRKVWVLTL